MYRSNNILSLCSYLGLNSDYIIPEVNDLGVTSAGGMAVLFLEDKEFSINLSLIKALVASFPVLQLISTLDTSMVWTRKAMYAKLALQ